MTSAHAARSPLPVGCQPSRSGIGFSEIPPAETTVARDGPLAWLSTCRSVGVPSCSAAAAATTASVGSTETVPDGESASPRTRLPPAKTTLPSVATLTVTCPPKTSRSWKRWFRLTWVTPLAALRYLLVTARSATSARVTPSVPACLSR